MNGSSSLNAAPLRLRLPATSANLGPGFDAAAVALDFYLEIEAEPASAFSIAATGRDRERCSRLENNLILGIYQGLLQAHGRPVVPLAIRMANDIPLGMGCGSSAAGRLAAIVLADRFGQLGWSPERILDEACELEGHPDNAAACRAIVVLPAEPLPTSAARAVLPESYSRADTVANIQSASLLGLAFAQARGDLLRIAMSDRIHQPYRAQICPLLPRLLPLAGSHGILGAALSGAGPSVLVITGSEAAVAQASGAIRGALEGRMEAELLVCRFVSTGASQFLETQR